MDIIDIDLIDKAELLVKLWENAKPPLLSFKKDNNLFSIEDAREWLKTHNDGKGYTITNVFDRKLYITFPSWNTNCIVADNYDRYNGKGVARRIVKELAQELKTVNLGKDWLDIRGLDKAELVVRLYEHSWQRGNGLLQPNIEKLNIEQVRKFLKKEKFKVDYIYGRPIKVNLSSDIKFFARWYNQENGDNVAQKIVEEMRKELEIKSSTQNEERQIDKNLEKNVKGSEVVRMNKNIIYEALLLNKAFYDELNLVGSDNYSLNHRKNADWYRNLSDRYNSILGFNGQTEDELLSYVSSLQLTAEQKRSLTELRKEPMFKKILGETALQQKAELESVLGSKITSEGMTFADENGARVAVKTEKELYQELDNYSDKLSSLLSSGVISNEQYEQYEQALDYIYSYYISLSKGEQIPFRKMTDSEYEKIEQQAEDKGISFSEQFYEQTEDIRYGFDEVQELQSEGMHSEGMHR